MIDEPWRIELFGGLCARQGQRVVRRFRTQKTAALLAYVAFHRGRSHAREVLVELFWPDASEESSRHSLSQALSSLRSQLEPPGMPGGSVIVADKLSVELNPDAFTTDVAEFEQALRRAALSRSAPDHASLLGNALDLYGGRLLEGSYEAWVVPEQERLAGRFRQAASDLVSVMEQQGDLGQALDVARRAVGVDPLHEDIQRALIRMLATAGRPAEAVRQYRELERLLASELGSAPDPSTRELARSIEAAMANAPSASQPPVVRGAGAVVAPARLPCGTVTFLVTAIDAALDSSEAPSEAAARERSLYQALMRHEFRRSGGAEVDEHHGRLIVAFGSALDALACAIAGQRSLACQEWPTPAGAASAPQRVRMALHTGDVDPDDERGCAGAACRRATAIADAGHGGQLLCSETTAALTRRDLDPQVRLRDLGAYRLRELEGSERLYQVDYPGVLRADFPPPRAAAARTARLPAPLTRFFGREKELRALSHLLADPGVRLVNLTGAGGTGKTRLALEVARQAVDQFAGSLWFVPLADLPDPAMIVRAVADAMGLPRLASDEPLTQVAEAIAGQPSLVILDNLEHMVDGGAEVVQALLATTPELKMLVTSRQVLGLDGEREFRVPPLPTPHGSSTPEGLSAFASVRLFVDRAQAVRPDFQVSNSNAPAVAELCDRLEGIPLAIELAAARAQMMTPGRMLEMLDRRFEFLVSRKRGMAERQRTLRAAIDWSYRLLNPELQRFFSRLAVFRGGWTVEAAEHVCAEPLALDLLAELRDGSLVSAEENAGPGPMRFRMLDTLREYARSRSEDIRDDTGSTDRRHADWYACHAAELLARVRTAEECTALAELGAEIENLRAALSWAHQAGDVEREARLALSLGSVLHRRGYSAEACDPLDAALVGCAGLIDSQPALYAELLRERAGLHFDLCEWPTAREKAEHALALCEQAGAPLASARAENLLGMIRREEGDLSDARSHFLRALWTCRRLAEPRYEAVALNNLGWLACRPGHDERDTAWRDLSEALRTRRRLGDRRGLAETLTNLGVLAYHEGDAHAAWTLYAEALDHEVALLDHYGVARSLYNMGEVALGRRDASRACRLLAGAEQLFREVRSAYAPEAGSLLARAVDEAGVAAPSAEALRNETAQLNLAELVRWALDRQPAYALQE